MVATRVSAQKPEPAECHKPRQSPAPGFGEKYWSLSGFPSHSEEFRAAHKDAGKNKPLYIDHPQFEGFEVRQTVRRGEAAVA